MPELELVLVTSIREPLNRLFSAYKFWGVLHNPGNKPPLEKWLKNMEGRAKQDENSPRGMGKGRGTGRDFIAQVGRSNFATWKFSGGAKQIKKKGAPDTADDIAAFGTAVDSISRFDLAIPMEELSANPKPLEKLLDWHDFSQVRPGRLAGRPGRPRTQLMLTPPLTPPLTPSLAPEPSPVAPDPRGLVGKDPGQQRAVANVTFGVHGAVECQQIRHAALPLGARHIPRETRVWHLR